MSERTITVSISAECVNEQQHLAISTMLKTLAQIIDMAVEARHAGNDCMFTISGAHPDSVTNLPSNDAVEHAMNIGIKKKTI